MFIDEGKDKNTEDTAMRAKCYRCDCHLWRDQGRMWDRNGAREQDGDKDASAS